MFPALVKIKGIAYGYIFFVVIIRKLDVLYLRLLFVVYVNG